MISPEVVQELMTVRQVLHYLPASPATEKGWTPQEQHLFWLALTKYPQGPWTAIADYIGTKSTRQAMTHAQKLRQKFKRWNSRLRRNPTARAIMDNAMGLSASEGGGGATADVAVSTGLAVESPLQQLVDNQAKDTAHMHASAGGYYPVGDSGSVMLGDFTVVSESKVEGEHHEQQQRQRQFAHQPQYAHQLGYMFGASASHGPPPSFPLAPAAASGGPYAVPPLTAALPPLHPSAASLETASARHQSLAQSPQASPQASPLLSRAMMDDLVQMLMAAGEEEEDEEEEDEEELGDEGLGDENE